MDKSVLQENTPLTNFVRNCTRGSSGVFSIPPPVKISMTSVFHALSQLFLETVNLSLWFQIDQNQNCSMDKVQNEGKEKKVNMQRLRSQQWRRHVGAHADGHKHGDRKPTETSVTKFCYKNVNLSLEGLKNTKISHFFNQHGSSDSRPPCKFHVRPKSLEIQA